MIKVYNTTKYHKILSLKNEESAYLAPGQILEIQSKNVSKQIMKFINCGALKIVDSVKNVLPDLDIHEGEQ